MINPTQVITTEERHWALKITQITNGIQLVGSSKKAQEHLYILLWNDLQDVLLVEERKVQKSV